MEKSKNKIKKRLFIYDFETNGLWHPCNQPIEVAIKLIEKDGEEINYHSYISCPRPLSPVITNLTGITDEILLKKGNPIEEVFKEINALLNKKGVGSKDTLVIGHNIIRFDNLFLNNYLQLFEYKTITKNQCFDTAGHLKSELINIERSTGADEITWGEFHYVSLGKRVEGVKYKLINACEYYGIKVKDPSKLHGAKVDVDYTYKVFLKQLEKMDFKL